MRGAHGQPARADLGRYHLAYRRGGAGRPTIVLEAGAGCTQDSWDAVFDRPAQFTSVVSYDRAGLGASDPAARPRTTQDAVRDLRDLLAAAAIGPRYALVGHSGGVDCARLCARVPGRRGRHGPGRRGAS